MIILNFLKRKLGDPKPEDLGYKHRTMSSVVNPNPPVPLGTYVPGLDADGVELLSVKNYFYFV